MCFYRIHFTVDSLPGHKNTPPRPPEIRRGDDILWMKDFTVLPRARILCNKSLNVFRWNTYNTTSSAADARVTADPRVTSPLYWANLRPEIDGNHSIRANKRLILSLPLRSSSACAPFSFKHAALYYVNFCWILVYKVAIKLSVCPQFSLNFAALFPGNVLPLYCVYVIALHMSTSTYLFIYLLTYILQLYNLDLSAKTDESCMCWHVCGA